MKKDSPNEQELMEIFMTEAKKYPVLSREEEISLARKAQAGCLKSKDRLVNCNLRLVPFFLNRFKYFKPGVPKMDLLSEGCLGLMRATELFDLSKGVRFATYAEWWIRSKAGRFLFLHFRHNADSLDEPAFNDTDETKLDLIPSEEIPVDLCAEYSQAWDRLKILNEREREALVMRFGEDKETVEIAKEMGIAKSRVNQIVYSALRKVRWDMNGLASRNPSVKTRQGLA